VIFILSSQFDSAEFLYHAGEVLRRGRQVEAIIPAGVVLLIEFGERVLQFREGAVVAEVPGSIEESLGEPIHERRINFLVGKLAQVVTEAAAKFIVIHLRARHADDCELIGQQIVTPQVVKRGK
jgi:hypothetical protein